MAKKAQDGMTIEQLTAMLNAVSPPEEASLLLEVTDENGDTYEVPIIQASVTIGFFGVPSKVVLRTE